MHTYTAYLTRNPLGCRLVLQHEALQQRTQVFPPKPTRLTKHTTLTRLLRPQTTALTGLFLTLCICLVHQRVLLAPPSAHVLNLLFPPSVLLMGITATLQSSAPHALPSAQHPEYSLRCSPVFPSLLQMPQWVSIGLHMKPTLHSWLRSSSWSATACLSLRIFATLL